MADELKPDNKGILEAYKQAQQMDETIGEENEDIIIDRFLDTISQSESSGGKDFGHRMIESGIHKGHRAIGEHGLMPNTILETINRAKKGDQLTPEMQEVEKMSPDEMKQYLENNPDIYRQFADPMAERALERFPSEEQAAYGWLYGHNLTPKQVQQRDYEKDPYVQKYRKFRKKLFGY